MRVHLLRSPELKEETYYNVLNLLLHYRGPIIFVACKLEETGGDVNKSTFHEGVKEKQEPKDVLLRWDEFFSKCNQYRASHKVPEDDLVILLTDYGNESNWFGAASPCMENYFIQTSGLEQFFGSEIDIRFPISYEVIVWVLRHFMFDSFRQVYYNIHRESIGCFMDYCQDKREVTLKMRTADVCPSCINKIIDSDVSPLILQHVFDVIDGIRASMTFRSRSKILLKPAKVEIRGYLHKIFFTDLGNLELLLNPKEKTLFLMFLNHPEGIELNNLQQYRDELIQYYSRLAKTSDPKGIHSAIDLLVNPSDNNCNETITKVNSKIKKAVGESLSSFYMISGNRGGKYSIKLDREYVTYNTNF